MCGVWWTSFTIWMTHLGMNTIWTIQWLPPFKTSSSTDSVGWCRASSWTTEAGLQSCHQDHRFLGWPNRYVNHNVNQLEIWPHHGGEGIHWHYCLTYSYSGQMAMDPQLDELGLECVPSPLPHTTVIVWKYFREFSSPCTNLSQQMHYMRSHLVHEPHARAQRNMHAWFGCVGPHRCWSHIFLQCMPSRAQLLLPFSQH